MEFERRTFKVNITRRDAGEGEAKKTTIDGHAAVFNSPADIGGFIEEIEPGFFSDSLKRSDPRALFNHDENYVLGRMSSNTLTLEEDQVGLHVVIDPPDTQLIRDMVLTPMDRGDLREMSFAWTTKANGDKWESMPDGTMKRTLLSGGCDQLYDASVVTYPAYGDTDCNLAMRSMTKWKDEHKPADPEPVVIPAVEPTRTGQAEAEFRDRELALMDID